MAGSSNQAIVQLANGGEVLLSYGVPVAGTFPGIGTVKTSRRYSVTTSRHINGYLRDPKQTREIAPEELERLSGIKGGR